MSIIKNLMDELASDNGVPITIENINFSLSKSINTHPGNLMIRELVQNSIEAVLTEPDTKKRKIKIFANNKVCDGVDKLCVFNTGKGMNAHELFQMCNIATKINKTLDLDANYGEGAKVASAAYNKIGMIYDSCTNGKVSRIWLRVSAVTGLTKRHAFDPRHDNRIIPGFENTVLDVSDEYSEEERKNDFTSVTLLGNDVSQDTTTNPYDTETLPSNTWIMDALYHRFIRIDPSIEITVNIGKFKIKPVIFETFEHRRTRPCYLVKEGKTQEGVFSKSETVSTLTGEKIHYIYDQLVNDIRVSANRNCNQSDVVFGGVVYKNELYSPLKGQEWSRAASSYGVGGNNGSRQFIVMVEVPDDRVLPNQHRSELLDLRKLSGKLKGTRLPVTLSSFAKLVVDNRPQWVKDIVEDVSVSQKTVDDYNKIAREYARKLNARQRIDGVTKSAINQEIDELINNGKVLPFFPTKIKKEKPETPEKPEEEITVSEEQEEKEKKRHEQKYVPITDETKKDYTPKTIYRLIDEFKYVWLTKDKDIYDRKMSKKAAMFESTTGTIYLNTKYKGFVELKEKLFYEYTKPMSQEDVFHMKIDELVRNYLALSSIKAIIRALSKANYRAWTDEEIAIGCSPESLTIAFDDDTYHAQLKSQLSTFGKNFISSEIESA